jgi:prepilin-type N-terminal cleavage/methylation domain-containing protein
MESFPRKEVKTMRRNEKGFTLIELLIVIIILGVLAVIGIPKFLNSKKDAWAGVCKTNRASLEDAAERYQFDKNVYPDGIGATGQAVLVTGKYIKRTYYCPASVSSSIDTYSFDGSSATNTGEVTCTNTELDITDANYHEE